MEKLNFAVDIKAPKEKVWKILWDDSTYRKWTSAFHEGSHAVSDWKEGSKILFLSSDDKDGMVSKIAANRPNEYMSFQHLGMVKDGKEDTTSEEVKKWAPSFENYTLAEKGGVTHLAIEMDIAAEYKDMFAQMWPKALENVRQLAENN